MGGVCGVGIIFARSFRFCKSYPSEAFSLLWHKICNGILTPACLGIDIASR